MHVLTLEKLAKDGLLAGKRVLIRSDLNAPHDENGRITNETRLVASVPAGIIGILFNDVIDSVLSTMTADDFNAMMDEAIAIQPLNQ